ncbi:UMP-CMP kinase 2, mitochondrial [Chiloscyllium plagiosum]|uniref:UMP-CMP kinase 2, mitochondrial n=1 Tax=Chiloscyllium plagiosum TaxID=36176 RepID=UPI001CB7CE60|nr:UMP-CMP kinase 2, mitochondrial [Chiloscyllium plagiosum]
MNVRCSFQMAQALGSALYREWAKRLFAIECCNNSEPLYFALSPSPEGPWDESSRLHQVLSRGESYSLCVASENRVEGAESYARLRAELTALPPRCRVMELMAFSPGKQGSLIKGFLVQDDRHHEGTERLLQRLVRESGQTTLCSYTRDGAGRIWQRLRLLTDGQDREISRNCLSLAARPELHPSVLNIKNSVIFFKYEDAYCVLKECVETIPKAKEILQLADQYDRTPRKGLHPVIVIEGLDATGKSTLTEALRDSLQATLLKSPPDCISHLRKTFDAKPPLIRRAFYALGNYITGSIIARESEKSPVIVDRFWHSTAAYAIATEVSGKLENLPPPHHELYQWPQDLIRPDLVLLLTVDAEERVRRLEQRGEMRTREEIELEANSIFRQKVEATYRRMENPACVVVDASASKEVVFKNTLHVIKRYCGIEQT